MSRVHPAAWKWGTFHSCDPHFLTRTKQLLRKLSAKWTCLFLILSFAQIRNWVDRIAKMRQTKKYSWPSICSSPPGGSQILPFPDNLALFHANRFHMAIKRIYMTPMVYNDQFSIAGIMTGEQHSSFFSTFDSSSGLGRNVNSVVKFTKWFNDFSVYRP